MIISHRHRYVFVELPLTGSTAIAKELMELYGGEPMLKKHSTYRDFLRVAEPAWKAYFAFSGIRHPLDQVVSHYVKLRTDHKGRYSDLATRDRRKGLHFALVRRTQRQRFDFVQGDAGGFPAFVRRYYRWPYSNWSLLDHGRMQSVVRFESLPADFDRTLRAIGIDPVRPLPVRNKTGDKGDWQDYFRDPDLRRHAVRVFGPFMRHWGYEFPVDWKAGDPTTSDIAMYRVLNLVRIAYWQNMRYRF